ncbi:MAG: hypothetical protein R3C03_23065 [Pirellulaceae bacterium]
MARALCFRNSGKSKEARQDLLKALELNPSLSVVYKQLVDIDIQQGNLEQALEFATKQIENIPDNLNGQSPIANQFLIKFDDVVNDLTEYLKLVPNDFAEHVNRAILLRDLGRTDESLSIME